MADTYTEARSIEMSTVNARARMTSDDGGFTLIEMIVAIFILAVTLLALLSTLVASLHAAQRNEARVAATALSNELLERMVAQPWDRLGLYSDEAPELTFEGQQVVLIPGPRDEAASPPDTVPRAEDSESRGGRDYTIRRWVTWVDDGTGQDFKRLVVVLEWDVRGETQTMRTEALRSPDPDERVLLEVGIAELVNDDTGIGEVGLFEPGSSAEFKNVDKIRIGIDVTDPSATVMVNYIDRDGNPHEQLAVGSGLTRSLDIAAGSKKFKHGPVAFAVTAEADGEVASNMDTLNFFQPLAVGTPVVSQEGVAEPICVDSAEVPVSPVVVDVVIEGMGPRDTVESTIELLWEGETLPMDPVSSTIGGGTFAVTVPGPFTPDTSLDFTVFADRDAEDPDLDATSLLEPSSITVNESTPEAPSC